MQNAKKNKIHCTAKSRSPILRSKQSCSPTNSSKLRRKSSGRSPESSKHITSDLHERMVNTFQGFVQQLDELFLSLKAEERLKRNGYGPEYTNYNDICDKLRQEVLIALDKLEITPFKFTGISCNEKNMEFLNKMNNLSSQLTDIRCQYHKAIREFDFRFETV